MYGKVIRKVDSLKFFQHFQFVGKTHSHYGIVSEWCEEYFGEFGDRWYRLGTDMLKDFHQPDVYLFKTDKDLLLFTLRWS